MANLSNVSPLAAGITGLSQGFSGAIRDVGAIYGIKQAQEQAARESELYPLKKQALEQQGAVQGMQLREAQQLEQPVDIDEQFGKLFQDKPNTRQLFEEALVPYMRKDPSGKRFVTQKGLQEAMKHLHTETGGKMAAIAKMADIDLQMEQLQPPVDEVGNETPEHPMDKANRELKISQLSETKNRLNKMYKILSDKKVKWLYDTKLEKYVPFDENNKIITELADKGYVPDSAIKSATDFEKYQKMSPAERKEYDEFKGAGKTATDKLTPKGFDQKGRAVYAGPEGNLVYEDKTPYKGGQLKGITEPWAPIPPEWEKKEQLNTVRNEIKDVTGQIDAVRKQMTWGLAENGPAEVLRLEKHLKDLKAEESRLTGKKEITKPAETATKKDNDPLGIR